MITYFSKKEFTRFFQQSISWYNYYQTPAGILKVFSIKEGTYKAEFIEGNNLDENITFLSDVPNLILVGTTFQQKVWHVALQIPRGTTCSYQDLAQEIGIPLASRAVARALAQNQLAYFVPCHRVIGKNGELCGYKWGLKKKHTLLDSEN